MTVTRWVRILLVIAVLLFFAYNGLVEVRNALRSMTTPGQKVVTATQLAYGVLSVLALASMRIRPRMTTPLLIAWAIPLVATAALAPVVYGGLGLGAGVGGGLVGLILAALTVRGWKRHYREADLALPDGHAR